MQKLTMGPCHIVTPLTLQYELKMHEQDDRLNDDKHNISNKLIV